MKEHKRNCPECGKSLDISDIIDIYGFDYYYIGDIECPECKKTIEVEIEFYPHVNIYKKGE